MIALLLLGCFTPTPPERTDPRPSIVVLYADDAGYADFSVHGGPFPTPRIDALASQGVRFTSGYVASSLCSPSRAALLTGRYPTRFGHENNPPVAGGERSGLPLTETLLSERLQQAGYTTAAIGKWHLGDAAHFRPNQRGFDHFSGFLRGERSYLPKRAARLGEWRVDDREVAERFTYVTDHIADEAVARIDATHRPLFLYVAFSAVHAPMEAQPSDLEKLDAKVTGKRRKLGGMTVAMDRAVGRILDALDRSAFHDDALVFFINDNGAGPKNGGSNAPFRGGKSRVYEGGVRVPFFARIPGVDPASFAAPVSTIDVAPTALAAAGVPIPPALDGVDLVPYLKDPSSGPPHQALFWRIGKDWAARVGDLKLVHDRRDGFGFFDLAADPGETTDLGLEHPARAQVLQAWEQWNEANVEPAFLSATETRRNKGQGKR